MHTVAIYRLLYGSDFIGESLASIYPHVDRIYCFVTRELFGGQSVVRYFGHDVYVPHDIDGVRDTIAKWAGEHDPDGKIEIVENPFGTDLIGQVSSMLNEIVLPREPDCTHVLFVEFDEVWHPRAIESLFDLARSSDADEFMSTCHLFWRSPRFISTRNNPYAVLRALKGGRKIGPTKHALSEVDPELVRLSDPRVCAHNFGYASSERTMFWKHLSGLSFSRDMELDSAPREEWFEEVWRAWDWDSNRRVDLCPSIGYELAFNPAQEYPFDDLPPLMQDRIKTHPLPEWNVQGEPPWPTSQTHCLRPQAAHA